jgi:hypothetical protein
MEGKELNSRIEIEPWVVDVRLEAPQTVSAIDWIREEINKATIRSFLLAGSANGISTVMSSWITNQEISFPDTVEKAIYWAIMGISAKVILDMIIGFFEEGIEFSDAKQRELIEDGWTIERSRKVAKRPLPTLYDPTAKLKRALRT